MKILIFLLLVLLGCGDGDSQTTSLTQCNDFVVDLSESQEITEVAAEEGVEGADGLTADFEAAAQVEDSNVVVVGCGGTFVDTDTSITTTTTTSETDNSDDNSLIRAMRTGAVTFIKVSL